MRTAGSILLLLLSLLIGLQQTITVVHFALNRPAIEQRFCVNKNKPALRCKGTCHLKKKLQETKETGTASRSIYPPIEVLPLSLTECELVHPATGAVSNNEIFKEKMHIAPILDVLVPPPIG